MSNINESYEKMLDAVDTLKQKAQQEEISDDDVNEIAKALTDAAKDLPSTALLNEAKKEADKEQQNTSSVANIYINPVSGKPMYADEIDDDDDELPSFEQLMEDDSIAPMDIDISKVHITEEKVDEVVKPIFGDIDFNVADYTAIINAANKYKNGEKFSYYNAMPAVIQEKINIAIGVEMGSKMGNFLKEGRNYIAGSLLNDIVQAQALDVTLYDFQKSINEVIRKGTSEIKKDEYWNSVRKYFLEDTLKIAADLRSKGEYDKADKYRAVRDAYVESYTFEKMKDLFHRGKLKVKKIQIEKFKRTCTEFNLKYQKSQNIIQEVSLILTALDRHANKKYDLDIIKEFICIFILYTQYMHMDPNNIVDHTFMYYFIHNILTLDYYDKEKEEEVKFHDQLINNINDFLEEIVIRKSR